VELYPDHFKINGLPTAFGFYQERVFTISAVFEFTGWHFMTLCYLPLLLW